MAENGQTLANNTQVKKILESIDSKLSSSIGFMKETLDLKKIEIKESKERQERIAAQEKLADIPTVERSSESSRKGIDFSKIKESKLFAGGIFGRGSILKAGLFALASPFILSFAKGLLFGEDGESGLLGAIGEYFTTGEGVSKTLSFLKEALNDEFTGTAIGTLIFGPKFLIAKLALEAIGPILEDKIRNWTGLKVEIPTGPIATVVSMIASSIIFAASKRALFAVGGMALAGLWKGGGRLMTKAAIAAAAAVGAKGIAKKMADAAAEKAAKEAAAKATKQAAKGVGSKAGVKILEQGPGRISYMDAETGKFIKKDVAIERLKAQGFDATGKPLRKPLLKAGPKAIAEATSSALKRLPAKSLPIVGSLIGAGFALERLIKGDTTSAALNAGAAAADLFPGVGTAASIAADVASVPTEVFHTVYGERYKPENKEHQAALLEIANEIQRQMSNGSYDEVHALEQQAQDIKYEMPTAADQYDAFFRQSRESRSAFQSMNAALTQPKNSGAPAANLQAPPLAQKSEALSQGSPVMAAPGAPMIMKGGDDNSVKKGGDNITVTNITNIVDPTQALNFNAAQAR